LPSLRRPPSDNEGARCEQMRPITPQTPTITLELAGEIVTRYRREAAKRSMPT
jgi:hypothetical protein